MGTFSLKAGNRIRFSPLATILKACPDVAVNKSALFEAFERTVNCTINGYTLLQLNTYRFAPLIAFKAVDFQSKL